MHYKKNAASVSFKILANMLFHKLYTSINASLNFYQSYMTWETLFIPETLYLDLKLRNR